MGGVVNSTAGRVLLGIATGGVSEVGRETAGIVGRTTGSPLAAAAAGGIAGGAAGGPSGAASGLVKAAVDANSEANKSAADPTLGTVMATAPTASQVLTGNDEYDMRRRASAANAKVQQGQRASQYLGGL